MWSEIELLVDLIYDQYHMIKCYCLTTKQIIYSWYEFNSVERFLNYLTHIFRFIQSSSMNEFETVSWQWINSCEIKNVEIWIWRSQHGLEFCTDDLSGKKNDWLNLSFFPSCSEYILMGYWIVINGFYHLYQVRKELSKFWTIFGKSVVISTKLFSMCIYIVNMQVSDLQWL